MNLKLYRTRTAEALTIRLEARTINEPLSATLSDRPTATQAVVDGLLWWALNRKLDAFLAHHVGASDITSEETLFKGVQLLHYVQTCPYHEAPPERLRRITYTIGKHLPELATLIGAGPDQQAAQLEHEELLELAQLIRERSLHVDVAEHGLATLLLDEPQAAAA